MIPTGACFTIYGWALIGDRLRGIADRRVKLSNASKCYRTRTLAVSWPNTAKGAKAADAWSGACNRHTAARFRPAVAS